MLVRCPSCATQLRLARAPTQDTQLRCPKCSTAFRVRPSAPNHAVAIGDIDGVPIGRRDETPSGSAPTQGAPTQDEAAGDDAQPAPHAPARSNETSLPSALPPARGGMFDSMASPALGASAPTTPDADPSERGTLPLGQALPPPRGEDLDSRDVSGVFRTAHAEALPATHGVPDEDSSPNLSALPPARIGALASGSMPSVGAPALPPSQGVGLESASVPALAPREPTPGPNVGPGGPALPPRRGADPEDTAPPGSDAPRAPRVDGLPPTTYDRSLDSTSVAAVANDDLFPNSPKDPGPRVPGRAALRGGAAPYAPNASTEESFQIPLAAFEQPAYEAPGGNYGDDETAPPTGTADAQTRPASAAPTTPPDEAARLARIAMARVRPSQANPSVRAKRAARPPSASSQPTNPIGVADTLAPPRGVSAPGFGARPSPLDELDASNIPDDLHSFVDGDARGDASPFGDPLGESSEGGAGFVGLADGEASAFGAPLSEKRQDPFRFTTDTNAAVGLELDHEPRSGTSPVEGIRGPAQVTKQVDPLMEFGDMFREVREAVGDSGARGRIDESLFRSGSREPAKSRPDARGSADQLLLKGGRPELDEDPFSRVGVPRTTAGVKVGNASAPPVQQKDDDEQSRLIDIALRDSGLHEPVSEENVAPATSTTFRDAPSLDIRDEVPRARGAVASALLVIVLTLVGVVGYVVYANGGLVDFSDPQYALAVAFRGAEPIAAGGAPAREGAAASLQITALPAGAPEGLEDELQLVDVVDGFYRTSAGTEFVLVEGYVQNDGPSTYRGIRVHVTLHNESGEEVAAREVPIGQAVEQPSLEEIGDAEALDALYAARSAEGDALALANNQRSPFTAAFLVGDDDEVDTLTATPRVRTAERAGECWSVLEFETAPPAEEASP